MTTAFASLISALNVGGGDFRSRERKFSLVIEGAKVLGFIKLMPFIELLR